MSFVIFVLFFVRFVANTVGFLQIKDYCGRPQVPYRVDFNDEEILESRNFGDSVRGNFQINAGSEAVPHSWPWQVMVLRRTSGPRWVYCCGGALISRRFVLTAAHCTVYSLDPSDYRILLGVHDKSKAESGALLYTIESITLAEGNSWNKQIWSHDLAVIKLSEDGRYGRNIWPVCLPFYSSTDFQVGDYCYVTGWGESDDLLGTSSVLMQAGLFIQKDCGQKFDPKTMICAGNGAKDTCRGDSGGPLVCQGANGQWYLLGITSRGLHLNCGKNNPGIYTKVAAYKEFVVSYLNKTNFE